MINFEKAIQIIESSVTAPATEELPLEHALNRVLARDVIADVDMPPFNKSAMDGFACRKSDLQNELVIIEEIPAGHLPVKTISRNECARIMTGAMVPEGADFILMKEHAVLKTGNKLYCKHHSEHANICYKGEDIKTGDTLLGKGTRLMAAQLAILAAAGCVMPKVYIRPRIAIISTGNELVEPVNIPGPGKIRNSNGIQLMGQVAQFGLNARYLGIVPDNRQMLLDTVADAISNYDLVLISGGVSVGDYDFVPDITAELKAEILFHGLNIKPGKHMLLGKKGNHFIAAMPGNPVSSFVLFETLLKPLLNLLMGNCLKSPWLRVPLAKSYSRQNQDLLFFIPVCITEQGMAQPLDYHGSAHIQAYSVATAIMQVPSGIKNLNEGDMVYVRPI